jgi:hypothetical protein
MPSVWLAPVSLAKTTLIWAGAVLSMAMAASTAVSRSQGWRIRTARPRRKHRLPM